MLHELLSGVLAFLVGASVCPSAPSTSGNQSEIAAGLVVESVVKGRQADRLGMRPGDIVYRWSSGAKKGVFESPFDPPYISVEQASRGPVVVYGMRGAQRHTWIFNSDSWSFQTRPNFKGILLEDYLKAVRLAHGGNTTEAVSLLNSTRCEADGARSWLVPWFHARVARILMHLDRWEDSNLQLKEAIELSSKLSPIVRIELRRMLGTSLEFRGDLVGATEQYSAMREEAQQLDPDGMEAAASSLMLASVAQQEDDLERTAAHLDDALNISKRLAPHSFQAATILEHLGILAESRNDLENAERNYGEALQIEERYFPDSRQLASTLTNLGTLAHWRGDFERAEVYHRRALLIANKVEQNGPQIAEILNNLGDSMLEQGYPETAELYQKRALEIQQRETPGTLVVALTLASLGDTARVRRHFEKAQDYYRRSIAAGKLAKAPERQTAQFIWGQANIFRDKREYRKAEELYRRALAIVVRSSPGSMDHAEILSELAGALAHQRRLDDAAGLYRQSLKMIEARTPHLGGLDEDRSRYRASNIRYFRAYADVLLQQGRQSEAFEIVEGSRGRTLLELLSRGHVKPAKTADPALLKRLREVQKTLQEKTEIRIRLAASEHTHEQLEHIDSSIDALLAERDDAKAQIRLSAPEYSALTEPQELSLNDIQKLLDKDTLLLEYSLGDSRSHVWAVTNSELVVRDLLPKAQIETAARDLYRFLAYPPISQPRSTKAISFSRNCQLAALKVSQMVLSPVAHLLGRKRLVIVADGALQYLPFGALPDPGQLHQLPLLAQHEIINLPSASILVEIRRRQHPDSDFKGTIAILADPVFDPKDERVTHQQLRAATHSLSPDLNDLSRSAADVGLERNGEVYLTRLIYTRKEAEAVAALFSRQKMLLALDFDASRSTVMSGSLNGYRLIHFATHGLLNSTRPELSGLVLSLVNDKGKPEQGFLNLQDIYNLKLHSELVVLSGCETALGKEINGEGLVGLTRGFIYAGANRVIASLWSVSDLATANLMAEFYRYLQARMRPAAALRAAQIQLWRHTQWNSPYYWAAFQIQGDWR